MVIMIKNKFSLIKTITNVFTNFNFQLISKTLLIILLAVKIISNIQQPGRTNLNYQIADYYGSRALGNF